MRERHANDTLVILEGGGVEATADDLDDIERHAVRASGQHHEVLVYLADVANEHPATPVRARLVARGAPGPQEVATGLGVRPSDAVRAAAGTLERRVRRTRERRRARRRPGAESIRGAR